LQQPIGKWNDPILNLPTEIALIPLAIQSEKYLMLPTESSNPLIGKMFCTGDRVTLQEEILEHVGSLTLQVS